MTHLTRRVALKLLTIGTAVGSAIINLPKANANQANADQTDASSTNTNGLKANAKTVSWSQMQDRVFLGGDCWANPMEDWQVVDGAAECGTSRGNRSVHLLTHQLTNTDGQFQMSVVLSQIESRKLDTGAGFKIGIRSDIN